MPRGVSVQGLLLIPAEEQKSQNAVPTKKRKSIYDTVTDTEMVERVFGFLPSVIGGQEGQSPRGFEVRPCHSGVWPARAWEDPLTP